MTDVSFAEEQLWLADRADPRTIPFIDCAPSLSAVVRIEGAFDEQALEASLNEIVRRHDVLRSRFVARNGRPIRVCEASPPIALARIDLRGAAAGHEDRMALATHVVAEEVRRPFDLACGPLVRATLVALGDAQRILAITVHHIVFDRWSKRVMAQELKQLYEAYAAGRRPPHLEPLPMQYPEYVEWQRQRLEGELGRVLMEHWRTRLRDLSDLTLPGDGSREHASTRAGSCWFTIPPADVARLSAMSVRSRVTLATLMLGILNLFLYRVSGADDLAVGVPASDRRRPEFERLIGLFSNAVVVRTTVSRGMTFLELLDRARGALVEACRYQDMPFGHLVRAIDAQRPLYRVLFNFMPVIPASHLELPGVDVQPVAIATEPESLADLSLHVRREGDSLVCRLVYKADLFSSARMQEFAAQFQALVSGVIDDPRNSVDTYDLSPASVS
jgi:hypothetical protein